MKTILVILFAVLVAGTSAFPLLTWNNAVSSFKSSISKFYDQLVPSDDVSVEKSKGKKKGKKPVKKPKKPKVDPACQPVSLDEFLPKDIEPSGCAYDPHRNVLWVISDNGFLVSTTFDGSHVEKYDIGEKVDLEDIVFLPDRSNFVYLAMEAPGTLLEYDLTRRAISRRWELFDNKEGDNQGVEALGVVPSKLSRIGYFFVAGSQADSRLHLFEIDLDAPQSRAIPVAIIRPPGPGEDLSAMATSPDGTVLFLLFDKHKQLLGVNVTAHPNLIPDLRGKPDPNPVPHIDARKAINFHFDLPESGAEGLAFTPDYLFLGIDASENRGNRKGLDRFNWPRQVTHCLKHDSGHHDDE